MMKSCLDFVNSIGYEDFKTIISDYFDHLMAFYKLCGTCDFQSISSITNNQLVEFHIIFANEKDAYTLQYALNTGIEKRVRVYNTWFQYTSQQINDRTLMVTISPCA